MTYPRTNYYFDGDQRFVVENYNWAKAFSNFTPGIAGKWGIPLWCYYVNRGQAVCSLGTGDKDGAILEFLSFNRACQLVGLQGFRTFLRVDEGPVYESFRKVNQVAVEQQMLIASHELELRERHAEMGLEIVVLYYPLVNQPVAGLVRQVTISNTGDAAREFQVVDGIPRVLPYGVTFEHVKVISRHIEGMMGVFEQGGVPIFRLKQTSVDISQVGEITGANFYLSCTSREGLLQREYLVDPAVVFGMSDDYEFPWSFAEGSVEDLLRAEQVRENRTPCAFTALHFLLSPGESFSFFTVIGHTPNERRFVWFLEALKESDLLQRNREENRELIEQIKNMTFTVSAEPLFDAYCQQTFLDNVLRGGLPLTFNQNEKKSVFYTYFRQGGDLERDYHWFVLEPTYLSQGNGHYRNVLQNRRMDTWFFPEVEDHNIRSFMNLIQLDGYNPLVINGQSYVARNREQVEAYLQGQLGDITLLGELMELVSRSFTPGEFIMYLEECAPQESSRYEEILGGLLPLCHANEVGDLHAGFWIDHWLYNLDLIEVYLSIYPERLRELLLERRSYTFFDDPDVVRPRSQKMLLVGERVRQYGAIECDAEKEALIAARKHERYKVRIRDGSVYRTNLFVKMLCVVANKLAALDPEGIGVEMEAGKPGWCDSLNGLPGLLGSSLCQTLELVRAFRFMLDSTNSLDQGDSVEIPVYKELANFIEGLTLTLEERLSATTPNIVFEFWERSHGLLENYRAQTRLGVDGGEILMKASEIRRFLQAGLNLLEDIFSKTPREKTFHPNGVPYTYYINEVTEYESQSVQEVVEGEHQPIRPLAFRQKPVALFLEGPVHYLRVYPDRATEVYASVRNSGIYDTKLGMFKSCESLADQPLELGRIKAYTSGWIENESIYTHMECKWLLEILRSGLAEQFMEDMRDALPPFLAPEAYGRSTLENCSFIVSSAFPDEGLHGQAFQPRLSGVTSEMLHIWTMMVAGGSPFSLDESGQLQLCMEPVLPDWLFTKAATVGSYWDPVDGWQQIEIEENCFAFRFLGRTQAVYHNPSHKPTFGPGGVAVVGCTFQYRDGRRERRGGRRFGEDITRHVREGLVRRMDIELA